LSRNSPAGRIEVRDRPAGTVQGVVLSAGQGPVLVQVRERNRITLRVHDGKTGQPLGPVIHPEAKTRFGSGKRPGLFLSPDGERVALVRTGDFEDHGAVELWHARTGRRIGLWAPPAERPWLGVAFSPEGHHIAAHTARAVRMWSAWTGELVRSWDLPRS